MSHLNYTDIRSTDSTIIQLLKVVALLIIAASVVAAMTIRNFRLAPREIYAYASALFQAAFLLMW